MNRKLKENDILWTMFTVTMLLLLGIALGRYLGA